MTARSRQARRALVAAGCVVALAAAGAGGAALLDSGPPGSKDSSASEAAGTEPGPGTGPSTRPLGAPPVEGEEPGLGGIEAAPSPSPSERGPEAVAPPTAPPVVPATGRPNATATGSLAAGHPRRVLPPVPGTEVRASSLSRSPGRLQVTLLGAGADTTEVLSFYRRQLTAQGFREVRVVPTPGAESAGFRWRRSSVVVTAGPETGDYTVFAVLQTRGA